MWFACRIGQIGRAGKACWLVKCRGYIFLPQFWYIDIHIRTDKTCCAAKIWIKAIELHLHIGTEKTGTSSAQRWFAQNRDALAKQGVCYPHAFSAASESPCHRLLSVAAMDFTDADDAFKSHALNTPELHQAFNNQNTDAFEKEVADTAKPDRWLMSSEHLHSRLTTVEKVTRVRQLLAPHFDRITVYIHLRPQIDMAVSLASTGTRSGVIIGPETFDKLKETQSYYNYFDLVARWGRVFGPDNLVVIPYRRQPDFCAVISKALALETKDFKPVTRINSGLDWQVIAMLNQLQRDGQKTLVGRLLTSGAIESMPKDVPLRLGVAMAKRIQSRFDHSNARLIDTIDSLEPGDLNPDWARYNDTANIERLKENIPIPAPVIGLLSKMASMHLLERIALQIVSAERADARGNHSHARQYIAKANRLVNELKPNLDNPETVATVSARAAMLARKFARKKI